MKKLFIVCIVAASLIGCTRDKDNNTTTVSDGKPVAPTNYQDGKGGSKDHLLPPMTPHWKESK